MKQTRVAIYSRVSTDRQSDESQVAEVREYCLRRGWKEPREFNDVISGAKFTKTGLDALMKEVRAGRLDVLACYKLDRLGRSLGHLALIADELTRHKVALICTSQGIDTSSDNPAGRLQLVVLMAVAEFERATIIERIKVGLKHAKAMGVHCGRPRTNDKHKPEIARRLDLGHGIKQIARDMKLSTRVISWTARDIRKAKAAAAIPSPLAVSGDATPTAQTGHDLSLIPASVDARRSGDSGKAAA